MADILCAGHICLDIIPSLNSGFQFDPGKLVEVGAATVATGGSVSNTGLALHRLGASVELCGKLGEDAFGSLVQDVVKREGANPSFSIVPGLQTSYTVVLNPPGEDRMFLHCPGANTEFGADDVSDEAISGTRIVHLGYPPLLQRLYRDAGEVVRLFARAHAAGAMTSMDMALPDQNSESGDVDWKRWLAEVLPTCDVFTPNSEELTFMLQGHIPHNVVNRDQLEDLAEDAGELGAKTILLKNGANGLFVRDGDESHHESCFEVEVVGTTGAGDATTAGFLFALLRGASLAEAARIAAAVGASSVERPDAVSGIPSWETLEARLKSGWKRRAGAPTR